MTTLITSNMSGRVRCDSCGAAYSLGAQSQFCPHSIEDRVVGPSIQHNERFSNWHADTPAAQNVRHQVEKRLAEFVSPDAFDCWLERVPSEDGADRIAVFARFNPGHPQAQAAEMAIAGLPDVIANISICSPRGD